MLRGRDPELAAVGDALASAVGGQGAVLLVEGPPGIGKSSLLAEARAMARRAGVRPLSGEASECRQTVPFGPLLAATLESDPPIERVELVRSLGGQPALRYWMLHDLRRALESAALDAPLALILDDLQWADSATLVALSTLPPQLSGTAIAWILAMCRGESRPRALDAMARLERFGARRLRLGALSEEAVAAVVADTLDAEADAGLLALAADARGNPFLLVELLDGLREEGRLRHEQGRAVVVGDGLPRRLAESMRERLDRLSDDARQALQVASVLGRRFSAEQLATTLQRRPSTLVAALQEALRADLLVESGERLGFRHELLRQAVLETLPRSLRRGLRREAASALLDDGAAAVDVARQLAGDEAGDRDAAADIGEGALAGVLAPSQEADLLLGLASTVARPTAARAEESRRALELPGLPPVLRARHLGWLTYNLASSGRLEEAASTAAPAIAAARETGDVQARTMATLGLVCADCARGACVCALERVEQLRRLTCGGEREPYMLLVQLHHADVLAELGRLDEALGLLADGVAQGRRERDAWLVETWARYGSVLRLAVGRLAEARAEAESSEATVDEVAAGSVAGAAGMLTLAEVAAHTGDARQLRASASAARRVLEGACPLVRRHASWILSLVASARHDPAGAVRWQHDDEQPYAAPFLPGDAGRQPAVVRIALAAGDPDLAQLAAEVAESSARASPGVPLLAATAAQARGLVDADSATLLDAARVLRATERPLLFASACEDAGRALARNGRTRDGVARLGEALDAYLACEATADARRVGRVLRRHGVRRRVPSRGRPLSGWASLTESELRVARLVGGGATNRDAAERLFLSPHTVSSHLRSAFAKLGINSRIELAHILVEEDRTAAAAAGRA